MRWVTQGVCQICTRMYFWAYGTFKSTSKVVHSSLILHSQIGLGGAFSVYGNFDTCLYCTLLLPGHLCFTYTEQKKKGIILVM